MPADESTKFPDECFFIAPIGADDSEIRRRSDGVMTYIVSKAAEEFGLRTVRADQIASPGQINLQVVEHVIGARAAVADLTGLNPNVFYEMAVRHTAKLPLVLIAERGTDLPFDIAQMRTIFFDHKDLGDADRCRSAIVESLREAIENGVVDSPISTAVDLSFLSSGSAADRSIAELVTTVDELARSQRGLIDAVNSNADRRVPSVGAIPRELIDDLEQAYSLIEAQTDSSDILIAQALSDIRTATDYLDRRATRRTKKPMSTSANDLLKAHRDLSEPES